jgi:hypothetical protein
LSRKSGRQEGISANARITSTLLEHHDKSHSPKTFVICLKIVSDKSDRAAALDWYLGNAGNDLANIDPFRSSITTSRITFFVPPQETTRNSAARI